MVRGWFDMDEETMKQLRAQLASADASLFFIAVLIVSVLLSWRSTAAQRDGLCAILETGEQSLPDVSFLRLTASTLAVAALTFFFSLSLDGWKSALSGGGNLPSAQVNLWASLLVLAAALLRLYDLLCLQSGTPSPDRTSQP